MRQRDECTEQSTSDCPLPAMELSEEARSRSRSRLQQLSRVRATHFAVGIAAKHACDLNDSRRAFENGDVGCRHTTLRRFGDDYVIVSARRDLRQM